MTGLLLPLVFAQPPAVDYTPGGPPAAAVSYDPTPPVWEARKVSPPADTPPAWLPPLPPGHHYVRDPNSPCGWHGVPVGMSVPKPSPPAVATPAVVHTDPFVFPAGACPPGRL